MTTTSGLSDQLARVAGLAEQQRRTLYTHVAAQAEAVSRDEAAGAVGIGRPLAAYHLDRLVRDGLLETRFERRTGRSGPGAGRPAKLYFRSRQALEVSVPARDYAFIAELMARALESDASGATQAAMRKVAYGSGTSAAANTESDDRERPALAEPGVKRALLERGYEPYVTAEGDIRLRNCPFDRLAEQHRNLVCEANLAFLDGLVDGLNLSDQIQPRLDPRPGECCVAMGPPQRLTNRA